MSYTDKELEEWEANFYSSDTDADKKISISELPTLLAKCKVKAPTDFHLKFALNILDSDGDRKIDFEEFCLLANPGELRKKLLQEFKGFLKEGRFLSKNDIKEALKKIRGGNEVSEEELDDVIRGADKNNDDKIDHKEFMEYFMGKLWQN